MLHAADIVWGTPAAALAVSWPLRLGPGPQLRADRNLAADVRPWPRRISQRWRGCQIRAGACAGHRSQPNCLQAVRRRPVGDLRPGHSARHLRRHRLHVRAAQLVFYRRFRSDPDWRPLAGWALFSGVCSGSASRPGAVCADGKVSGNGSFWSRSWPAWQGDAASQEFLPKGWGWRVRDLFCSVRIRIRVRRGWLRRFLPSGGRVRFA